MKLYVGVTDRDWFNFLRDRNAQEMNFWRPRASQNFNVLEPGGLFLFKSKFPENKIVGGAFFVRHSTLPLDLAWTAFGEANGVASLEQFRRKILSLRRDQERNPTIGCTVLTQPFYVQPSAYIEVPSDWSGNIVSGKSYDISEGEGKRLYAQAQLAMQRALPLQDVTPTLFEEKARYGEGRLVRPRLGQGGFRVTVIEEYQRRCALTGEKTLPVLQAAHIKPYAENGPHDITNGMLLRSDLHTLFDKGYLTVTTDLHVEVSRRIKEEFNNGKEYYALHGKPLKVMPSQAAHRPAASFLEWHQTQCYLG